MAGTVALAAVEAGEETPPAPSALPDARQEQRGGTKGRVLVLNASYEPVNVCTVRRATVLILKERAEIIDRSEAVLHAESFMLPHPVVIRLVAYVRIPRDAHSRKITRRAIFARDRWTCQYCGNERGTLTVDHVVPRSKGGTSVWENIVTCCAPCNRRKGDREPAQANMPLRRKPRPPNSTIFVHVATPRIPSAWEPYLLAA
jgi:5-methylcytosine-specific restriction endonuclease McrA